ncbi:MAG: hypothetical protein WAO78_04450 [Roseovarius sp.]
MESDLGIVSPSSEFEIKQRSNTARDKCQDKILSRAAAQGGNPHGWLGPKICRSTNIIGDQRAKEKEKGTSIQGPSFMFSLPDFADLSFGPEAKTERNHRQQSKFRRLE